MKKIINLICIKFVLLTFVCNAQNTSGNEYYIDYNNLELPKSPNASSLGIYGDTPVNTAVGLPSINIPIYTLELDGVQVPISLSYHASGVKVTELATAVGLKWTLNAGGGIFRSVSSKPDDNLGWLHPNFTPLSDDFYDNAQIHDYNWQETHMVPTIPGGERKTSRHDHNPDSYNYQVLGFSGKFILTQDGDVLKIEADNTVIDQSALDNQTNPALIDQKGNKYFFYGNNETSQRAYRFATHRTDGEISLTGKSFDNGIITGWMLSKIQTKNNKFINFEYEPYTIEDTTFAPVSSSITYANKVCGLSSSSKYAELSETVVLDNYTVQLIKKITTENIEILFNYSEDKTVTNWQRKLTKISIIDKIEGNVKEFGFEYDKFNGDPRLKLKKFYEIRGNNFLPGYEFWYNNGNLPTKYSKAQDFFGYYNGYTNNVSLAPKLSSIKDFFPNFKTFYDANTGNRTLNSTTIQYGVLEKIKYPTGGTTEFTFEPNSEVISGENYDKYVGGLRIKEILNKDNNENEIKKTLFTYDSLIGNNLESNISLLVKEKFDEYNTSPIAWSFHSNFVERADILFNGYFYKKVTQIESNNAEQHKVEYNYEEHFKYGSQAYLLKSEKIYQGSNLAKVIDYQYDYVGNGSLLHWNILGSLLCVWKPRYPTIYPQAITGYNKGVRIIFTGDKVKKPSQIATTDLLNNGSGTEPFTVIKKIFYDDDTLLPIQEITDSRYSRNANGTFSLSNPNGDIIIVDYKYPWSTDINQPHLPLALPISKKVYKNNENNDILFGQYFKYDTEGNIKTTFQYNKGEGSNSEGGYIPGNYEKMTSFIYNNGKPVQVLDLHGSPTTYIWGLNGQFPVAKIEGKFRAQINQSKRQAVEQASYNGLESALNSLRGDASVQDAMITTYTYKPLAGVETITDPKGDKITYYYDEFGRLEYVKDKDGNRLTENEYNYGSQ